MTIWEGIDYNKHGQLTFSMKGGIRQRMEYYPETGYLLSSTASDIQSFEYHYDALGNMDHRYDHLHKVNGQSLHEQFYYDSRNQLTDTYLNGTLASHIIYDNPKRAGCYDAAIVYWSKCLIPIQDVVKRLK